MDMYGSGGQYVAPPAPLMDEIEVINGGAALMYGPQPGGAINFRSPQLTRDTTFGGKVGATYGSYDLISTVNSVKGKSGNTAYWGGYFRKQGKGYQRAGADFSADHLQLKTHTFRENGDVVKLGFQGYDSDFGQPGGMTEAAANAQGASRTSICCGCGLFGAWRSPVVGVAAARKYPILKLPPTPAGRRYNAPNIGERPLEQ